jgi:rhamnosyltransferase
MQNGNRRVVGVMCAFQPAQDIEARCEAALTQVDDLIIIDDGSGPGYSLQFDALRNRGIWVIKCEKNAGIAAGLNLGITEAIVRSADYVLTLDQDSLVPPGFVERLVSEHRAAERSGIPVGTVAPWKISGTASSKVARTHKGFLLGSEPIQSGQVIPIATFERVGSFDEKLFIDFVDTDFYLRLRSAGLEAVFVRDLNLEHSIGEGTPARFLGRLIYRKDQPLTVRFHAPFRTYYIFRNALLLLRKPTSRQDWVFAKSLASGMAKRLLITILFAPEKRKQVRAVIAGLVDGLRGHSGRIPDGLRSRLAASSTRGG